MVQQHQGDLFARGNPELVGAAVPQRHWLDDRCWIDHAPGWLPGGDTLMRALELAIDWRREQRLMYERVVDVPRLMADLDEPTLSDFPILRRIGQALSVNYELDLRRGFAAYYRHGNDSVAWHNDRVDMGRCEHTSAIVSLGGPRRIMFRSKSGGRARSFTLASGDLLVQGGAIQHLWQHCVPKVKFAYPRLSLMFFGHGLEQLPGTLKSQAVPLTASPSSPTSRRHPHSPGSLSTRGALACEPMAGDRGPPRSAADDHRVRLPAAT